MKRARRSYRFRDGKRLILGERTLVMGILNVTPDSFSDGGQWDTPEKALLHARQMVEDGADIIDVGAESSRPGFVPISAAEEIKRLRPFLETLLPNLPVPVSVDTFKAETAAMAAELGVHLLNDIWGLQYAEEPGRMAETAARYDLPVVVMHNQAGTDYGKDLVEAMKDFFKESRRIAQAAGLPEEKLLLDPGIGFGKTAEQNLIVQRRLAELSEWDGKHWPILLGASRKSFIGAALGLPVEERMEATGAACVLGIAAGVGVVRVHDVKPIARMCRMADAILDSGCESQLGFLHPCCDCMISSEPQSSIACESLVQS
ncbi:MAG: dihydropteroate synthase [Schwartzia sp.]|nr:dihydropteroate synthase [Schwartzia sp. (in: firmicutes)]MBR1886191.1 dihydropteroate synthase [Schwartzia sp. (in: firmicutes)]